MGAVQNLEGIASVFPPFQRVFNEGATNDSTSDWKNIIPSVAGVTRPAVVNGLVYDWRLHVPAIIKAIPQQLAILAAVDGAFGTNPAYNFRVNRSRTALLQQYDNMYEGLVCGAKDVPWSSYSVNGRSGAITIYHIGLQGGLCRYSHGLFRVSLHPWSHPFRQQHRQRVRVSIAASPEHQAEYKYATLEIRAGIAKRMPFFSAKSLADSLYRVTNPGARPH